MNELSTTRAHRIDITLYDLTVKGKFQLGLSDTVS